jgi:hypothetical protein
LSFFSPYFFFSLFLSLIYKFFYWWFIIPPYFIIFNLSISFQSLTVAPFSIITKLHSYILVFCSPIGLTLPFSPYSFFHVFPHLSSFKYVILTTKQVNFIFQPQILYHIRMLVPFAYNVGGYIENVANGILLHVNIWLGIELVNLYC